MIPPQGGFSIQNEFRIRWYALLRIIGLITDLVNFGSTNMFAVVILWGGRFLMGDFFQIIKKQDKKTSFFMLYIKIVVIFVIFSAFITYLAAMPDSMSFFTAASRSEEITIEFGNEE